MKFCSVEKYLIKNFELNLYRLGMIIIKICKSKGDVSK